MAHDQPSPLRTAQGQPAVAMGGAGMSRIRTVKPELFKHEDLLTRTGNPPRPPTASWTNWASTADSPKPASRSSSCTGKNAANPAPAGRPVSSTASSTPGKNARRSPEVAASRPRSASTPTPNTPGWSPPTRPPSLNGWLRRIPPILGASPSCNPRS